VMPDMSNARSDEIQSDLFSGRERTPSGWMPLSEGEFAPGDALPSEATRGAWAVDAHGRPIGCVRRARQRLRELDADSLTDHDDVIYVTATPSRH
jgi:hypothetical protein